MAPRQRNKENKKYPTGWRMRKQGNKYYIFYRASQPVRHLWDGKAEPTLGIGNTLAEAEKQAYQVWTDKINISETPHTMGRAIDRYESEVIPTKKPATQKSNRYSLARLRKVIPTAMPITSFETHHGFQYRDQCAKLESPKKANLDLEVLSHIFSKCLEWGTPGLREHPIMGKVRKISIAPRDRYVEDWELDAFLSTAGAMLNVYVPLKHALGIDKSMVLKIRLADIKEDRLQIQKRAKIESNAKAKRKDYLFRDADGNSTGLEELINAVKAWRRVHLKVLSPWLFCTSHGQPYIKEDGSTSGFDSIWQRSMKKALESSALTERFHEHDICAKTSSDTETLEQAAQLRGHLNTATTDKVYRRKPQQVMPHNIGNKKGK